MHGDQEHFFIRSLSQESECMETHSFCNHVFQAGEFHAQFPSKSQKNIDGAAANFIWRVGMEIRWEIIYHIQKVAIFGQTKMEVWQPQWDEGRNSYTLTKCFYNFHFKNHILCYILFFYHLIFHEKFLLLYLLLVTLMLHLGEMQKRRKESKARSKCSTILLLKTRKLKKIWNCIFTSFQLF